MPDPDFDGALRRGADLFREGAFFEAHEAWEAPWRAAEDPAHRRLLQGLVQVAAALHKLLVMKRPESAARILARGLAKLDLCPPVVSGLDLARFRAGMRACEADLAAGAFETARVPALETVPARRPRVIEP